MKLLSLDDLELPPLDRTRGDAPEVWAATVEVAPVSPTKVFAGDFPRAESELVRRALEARGAEGGALGGARAYSVVRSLSPPMTMTLRLH